MLIGEWEGYEGWKHGSRVLTGYYSTENTWTVLDERLEKLLRSKKNQGLKLFQRASIFAPSCLFHLTGYLKDFVPFDKPEVLSSCSADWLLVHQLCPNQKCNKLGFPNRHQGAICPDSAGPAYFSASHFLLGISIANHPYLWRKQTTSLKLSFCNLENKKNPHPHWIASPNETVQCWKICARLIPSIRFLGSNQS